MFPYTANEFVFILASAMAILGGISMGVGIAILAIRGSGRSVQTIADQTTKLAQKGLAEEISGLVGNASSLMEALNQLVRTTAGIGIFLVVFGFVMLVSAYLMVKMF